MRQRDSSKGEEQSRRLALGKHVGDALRRWPPLRLAAYLLGIVALLLIVQNVLLALTAESLHLAVTPARGTLSIDGRTLSFPLQAKPTAILLATPDPLTREFQIDGSDSTNNFSLDPAYIASIAGTPYYRFQAWMRDSSSYSSWRDVRAGSAEVTTQSDGSTLVTFTSTSSQSFSLSASLLRPETPSHIYLRCGSAICGEIIINRNDRYVLAHGLTPEGAAVNETRIYFPEEPVPFLAEVLYLLAQVVLWSLVMLLVALALSVVFA
ncbi:MAG: hypothetical protein ACM3N4_10850, partial [Nitrososphaerota archaeon]